MNGQEKIFKTMSRVGLANIVLGAIVILSGIVTGTLTVVNGASLLRRKNRVLI